MRWLSYFANCSEIFFQSWVVWFNYQFIIIIYFYKNSTVSPWKRRQQKIFLAGLYLMTWANNSLKMFFRCVAFYHSTLYKAWIVLSISSFAYYVTILCSTLTSLVSNIKAGRNFLVQSILLWFITNVNMINRYGIIFYWKYVEKLCWKFRK